MLVYSGFQCFLICFTYSLTLLSPLCPHVPAPSVVIYVVKNASRPVSGEDSPMPSGKRFAFQIVCIVTLSRVLCKWFLRGWQIRSCGAIDKEESLSTVGGDGLRDEICCALAANLVNVPAEAVIGHIHLA